VTEQLPSRGNSKSLNWKAAIKHLRDQGIAEYDQLLQKRIKRGKGLPAMPPQVEEENKSNLIVSFPRILKNA